MSFVSESLARAQRDWELLFSALLLLAAVLFVGQTVRTWYRLRHFKGPFWASFSKLWLIRHVLGGSMHSDVADVCRKYGSIARVGPNHLITSDPELLRRMWAVRSPYRRSDWYIAMRFDPSRENVESERDEAKHNALRAKMAAGYSGKEVENLEQWIDYNISNLIKLIDKYVSTDTEYKPLDFARKAQYFTLDVISSVAYSKPFGYLIEDRDVHDYIRITEEALPAIMLVTILPWINWILQTRLVKRFLPSEKDPIGFGKVMGITKRVVAERFGPDAKNPKDMLGSFLAHGLTRSEAESETLLQIIAGSDTTATAIRTTLLHLTTNARVLRTLRAEYTTAAISTPITDAEARALPYLQACIKETLRIWPPVVGLMSKEVPAGGDVLPGGAFVPGGVSIGYCGFGLFRDEGVWGADAGVFRPERWMEGGKERIREMEGVLELVFAGGKWQCLGRNVALMELGKVVVELLRRFDFALVDPTTPWKSRCNGIFSQSEMWMRVTRRAEGSESL